MRLLFIRTGQSSLCQHGSDSVRRCWSTSKVCRGGPPEWVLPQQLGQLRRWSAHLGVTEGCQSLAGQVLDLRARSALREVYVKRAHQCLDVGEGRAYGDQGLERHDLVEGRTYRPDVRRGHEGPLLQHFRAAVDGCADCAPHHVPARRVRPGPWKQRCAAQVTDLQRLAVSRQEDVAGLEVAVYDAAPVQVRQPMEGLCVPRSHALPGHGRRLPVLAPNGGLCRLVQVAALQQGHEQETQVVGYVLPRVHNEDHRRPTELLQQLGLALHVLLGCAAKSSCVDLLQGEGLAVLQPLGLVHDARGAPANGLDEQVVIAKLPPKRLRNDGLQALQGEGVQQVVADAVRAQTLADLRLAGSVQHAAHVLEVLGFAREH
mmetsp:Transcript_82120/g.190696  ORF Transcript_82120/g.190696 Transcript_82120/m.190696 type:complete len:374 (-) Transcript_82120:230-1351(-)